MRNTQPTTTDTTPTTSDEQKTSRFSNAGLTKYGTFLIFSGTSDGKPTEDLPAQVAETARLAKK